MTAQQSPKDNPANILVFDSGVGGLSLVSHIRQALPGAVLTYLADTEKFPYGQLDENELVDRVCHLINKLCETQQPDVVVVGCNTASTLVLPKLRELLTVPVVGVVPAIKPAAQLSSSKVIGLLATQGTIQREYTDELIADFAHHCEVVRVGSNELVNAVEKKLAGETVDDQVYHDIAKAFSENPLASEIDTIVLACTHFPHAVEELQLALPAIRHWIDSGEAIARRVVSLLNGHPRFNSKTGGNMAYFTRLDGNNNGVERCLEQFGFNRVEEWNG